MSNEEKNPLLCHWADQMADKIIKEKGDLELYTCASGITPSGTVHLGISLCVPACLPECHTWNNR